MAGASDYFYRTSPGQRARDNEVQACTAGEQQGRCKLGAMPSRAQSEFYKGLLPIELSDEAPAVFTADLKNDRFANRQPPDGEEISRPLARVLVPFCIGVAAQP